MRTMRMAIAISVLIALGRSSSAQGAVHVVDDVAGPGVDFTSFQSAIDAAADGDTILVKDGAYGTADVDGKSLEIAADAPAGSVKTGGVRIRNLVAGQQVVLRGLELSLAPALPSSTARLAIQSNAGVVWVEDCLVKGLALDNAARVDASTSVVLLRSRFEGGTVPHILEPFGAAAYGGIAARMEDSAVHVYTCALQGGPGGYNPYTHATGIGGSGAVVYGGVLFAADSSFLGGPGGGGLGCGFSQGGSGMSLVAGLTAPDVHTLDCAFQGGAGYASCVFRVAGMAIQVYSGTHAVLAGTPCSLTAGSPIREGQSIGAQLSGEPGSIAALVIGLAPGASFLPSFLGSLLLDVPFAVVGTLVLPGSGTAALNLPFGSLPAGLESQAFYGQLGLLTPSMQIQACAGSALLVLDQQF